MGKDTQQMHIQQPKSPKIGWFSQNNIYYSRYLIIKVWGFVFVLRNVPNEVIIFLELAIQALRKVLYLFLGWEGHPEHLWIDEYDIRNGFIGFLIWWDGFFGTTGECFDGVSELNLIESIGIGGFWGDFWEEFET